MLCPARPWWMYVIAQHTYNLLNISQNSLESAERKGTFNAYRSMPPPLPPFRLDVIIIVVVDSSVTAVSMYVTELPLLSVVIHSERKKNDVPKIYEKPWHLSIFRCIIKLMKALTIISTSCVKWENNKPCQKFFFRSILYSSSCKKKTIW